MKPLTRSLLLIIVVTIYSLLYLATKRVIPCDGNCQSLYSLDTLLTKKFDYVYGTFRCTAIPSSDTLCIYVKDTIGINWDRFADTVCIYANIAGLYQQKIFLIKNGTMPPDTVARKQCP